MAEGNVNKTALVTGASRRTSLFRGAASARSLALGRDAKAPDDEFRKVSGREHVGQP